MTDDLVKRLREGADYEYDSVIMDIAADRIEQLEAALRKIAHVNNTTPPFNSYVDKEIWLALRKSEDGDG